MKVEYRAAFDVDCQMPECSENLHMDMTVPLDSFKKPDREYSALYLAWIEAASLGWRSVCMDERTGDNSYQRHTMELCPFHASYFKREFFGVKPA